VFDPSSAVTRSGRPDQEGVRRAPAEKLGQCREYV